MRASKGGGAGRPGWFKALDDQKIGKALAQLHRDPGAAWTVELLADTVAMSPSRFAAHFRETTGQVAYTSVSFANGKARIGTTDACSRMMAEVSTEAINATDWTSPRKHALVSVTAGTGRARPETQGSPRGTRGFGWWHR